MSLVTHVSLEFLEKISVNNFALSDTVDNTSGPSNREVIADLTLLKTLLAIYNKLLELKSEILNDKKSL